MRCRPTLWRSSTVWERERERKRESPCVRLLGARTVSRRFPGFSGSFSFRRCRQARGAACGFPWRIKEKGNMLISAAMLAPGLAIRPFVEDSLKRVFVQMFPLEWVTDAPFPFVQDLVNGPPFTDHRTWLEGARPQCGWVASTDNLHSHAERTTTRRWRNTTWNFLQLPWSVVLQMGLVPEEHFAAWNLSPLMGPCHNPSRLPGATAIRKHSSSACSRQGCGPTSLHVQKEMRLQVHLAVAILLVFWPDCSLPMRHVAGFSNHGLLERTRVLRPVLPEAFLSQKSVLEDAAKVMELLVSKVPTNPTSFLSCDKDVFTKDELDQKCGKERWLAMVRFEVSQGTGDSRASDDGAKLGHASGTGYSETLDILHGRAAGPTAREIVKALGTLGAPQPEQMKRPHSARRAVSQHCGCMDHSLVLDGDSKRRTRMCSGWHRLSSTSIVFRDWRKPSTADGSGSWPACILATWLCKTSHLHAVMSNAACVN